MKKTIIWLLSVLILSWCWTPIIDETNPALKDYNNTKENVETIQQEWVVFSRGGWIEMVYAFLTNSWEMLYTPKPEYSFEKAWYKKYEIEIEETVFTWCVWDRFFNDEKYKKYVDESFECEWTLRRWGEVDENRWYTMIIPWGKYEAYLPEGEKVTNCSTTNPIVCRNEDYKSADVSSYYDKNGKCPEHMRYLAEWVSWPTAYCAIQWWSCHMSTCDYIEKNWKSNVRSCDLEPRLDCWFNWSGPMYALGDPCDFFLWMWMAPADWSCDHKLKK